jgi:hypothetical protein
MAESAFVTSSSILLSNLPFEKWEAAFETLEAADFLEAASSWILCCP